MTDQPDRRTAQKQRSRDQILAAARDLIEQQRSPRFTVDQLAERADVSRRTIFNHFATLDDVIVALAASELDDFVTIFGDCIAASGRPLTRESVFAAAAQTIERIDIHKIIAFFVRALGTEPKFDGHTDQLFHTTFNRTGGELIDEIVRTSDDLDAFDAEVAIGQAISGLAAAARHWAQETGTSLDAASRGRLDDLLARVTATWPLGS